MTAGVNGNANKYERDIQNKLFDHWKEFMEEYTKTKNLEMAGNNCKEAWMSCMKMQQDLFSMWQEFVGEMQSCNINTLSWRKKNCPFWRSWLKLQKEFLKKWEYTMKMEELIPNKSIEKFYEVWFDMMNESFKTVLEQWQTVYSKSSKSKTASTK